VAEGATRAQFEAMTRAIGWPTVRADLRKTPQEVEMVWLPGASAGIVRSIGRFDSSAESLPAR
jgi:hypothetical protein